jgi:uncharacterized protein YecE (DUF72 family)
VYKVLEKHEAALCIHDLIAGHPWILTTSWTYIRFHGPRATVEPYQGRYTASRLWPTAKRLSRWLDEGTDVYGYFNNDWDANAVADALYLRGRLSAYEAAAA